MEKRLKELESKVEMLARDVSTLGNNIINSHEFKAKVERRFTRLVESTDKTDQRAIRNERSLDKCSNSFIHIGSDINELRERVIENEKTMYFLNDNTPYKEVDDIVGNFKVASVAIVFSKKGNPMFEYTLEDCMGFKDDVSAVVDEVTLKKMEKAYGDDSINVVKDKYKDKIGTTFTVTDIDIKNFDNFNISSIIIKKELKVAQSLMHVEPNIGLTLEFRVMERPTLIEEGLWNVNCKIHTSNQNISKVISVIPKGTQLLIY